MKTNKHDYCECDTPKVKYYEASSKSRMCELCKKMIDPAYVSAYRWVESLSTISLIHDANGNIIRMP